jgi:hypothetical protein
MPDLTLAAYHRFHTEWLNDPYSDRGHRLAKAMDWLLERHRKAQRSFFERIQVLLVAIRDGGEVRTDV